jgi:hypothetical protein
MTQPFKPAARPRARKQGRVRKVARMVAPVAMLFGLIAALLFGMPFMAIHFNGAARGLQGQLSRGIVLCDGQPLAPGNTCEVVSGTSDYDTTSAPVLNQMAEGTIANDHDDAWICFGFGAVSWLLAIASSALVCAVTLRKAKARRVLAASPAD